jgi:hypothetical protein
MTSKAAETAETRFMLDEKTLQAAAQRRYGDTFKDGVGVGTPYWIDVDCDTVRVGIGYGPDGKGGFNGSFGANYNYRTGEFE